MPLLFVAPFVIAAAATAGVVGVPAATIALAENQAEDAVRATELLVLALAPLLVGTQAERANATNRDVHGGSVFRNSGDGAMWTVTVTMWSYRMTLKSGVGSVCVPRGDFELC